MKPVRGSRARAAAVDLAATGRVVVVAADTAAAVGAVVPVAAVVVAADPRVANPAGNKPAGNKIDSATPTGSPVGVFRLAGEANLPEFLDVRRQFSSAGWKVVRPQNEGKHIGGLRGG